VTTRASQLELSVRIESKKRAVTVGEINGAGMLNPPALASWLRGQAASAVGPVWTWPVVGTVVEAVLVGWKCVRQ
jgi:hypothetical protein